jgi:hypothetical protein
LEHRGRAVPEIMQPDRRQAEPGDQCAEVLGDRAGAKRGAVLAGERLPRPWPKVKLIGWLGLWVLLSLILVAWTGFAAGIH